MDFLVDPYWPWKQPASLSFWLAMAGLFAIILVTLWSYIGVPGATFRRIIILVLLRLTAFFLALIPLLRPAMGILRHQENDSLLWVLVDASESMTVGDETGGSTRWDLMRKQIGANRDLFERLKNEQGTTVKWYSFAEKAADWDPDKPAPPNGKLTDIGGALHQLLEQRGQTPSRGLILLSDGSENGPQRFPARAEAGRWLATGCPVQTFSYGSPTTTMGQKDVALTNILTEPSPLIPMGGELTVKVRLDAPGFTGSSVRVLLKLDDKVVSPKVFVDGAELPGTDANRKNLVRLNRPEGTEVWLKYKPMDKTGEIKVEVIAEDPERPGNALTGEQTPMNNTIGTYVTVAKEGISVLYLEKPRAWEPLAMIDAMARDPQISVYPVWIRGGLNNAADQGADPLGLGDRAWDVVILGDVLADQIKKAGGPEALARIEKMVRERGAGFLTLGGYSTYGDGDWVQTPIESLLPVRLDRRGQVEKETRMLPTEPGLRLYGYVMNLGQGPGAAKGSWDKLREIEGHSVLGTPKPGANILADSSEGVPVLVSQNYGNGRVMAFAGDTTHRWVRNPETKLLHDQFWQRMIRWLAHREDQGGSVFVAPDTRRLPMRNDLGFRVGLRSKSGSEIEGGTYVVEVQRPDGTKGIVPTGRTANEVRGRYEATDKPGEYRLIVRGEGKDVDGTVIQGEATARFLVFEEDQEMARIAADPTFLETLARSGGGQFAGERGERLGDYLRTLLDKPPQFDRSDFELYPDWRNMESSPTGSGFLAIFYMIFVAVVGGEWFLRRIWGLA